MGTNHEVLPDKKSDLTEANTKRSSSVSTDYSRELREESED